MRTIFDKMQLRNLTLNNRIFRSATWMAMADYNGYVTDKIVDLYKSYAEGGIGAIITGIHGNFYSNPFYYNIGDTLNAGGFDFIYAQTII